MLAEHMTPDQAAALMGVCRFAAGVGDGTRRLNLLFWIFTPNKELKPEVSNAKFR